MRVSTTAALEQFVGSSGACNDSAVPALNAGAARPTTASSAPQAVGLTTPRPPGDAALRAPSMGSTPRPVATSPFLTVAFDGLGPRHGQKGVCQQRQGAMPIPAKPFSHLILIQPHLPFGRF
jgi:hypothetical protein